MNPPGWAILLAAVGFCYVSGQSSNGAPPNFQCPVHQEVSPCVCNVKKNGLDIMCEFTDNYHINKAMAVLKGKSGIVVYYLKLRHNNLPKLQSFIFLGIDIRHLTIHNSSLAVIEESSLSSMGIGLTQLDLSQNSLGSVPSPAFKNLHHLLILNMNHNKISVIHSRAFEGLDTLEILTLYENKISTIEDGAFKGLAKKLRRLNIGGNGLTAVPKAVGHLENLRKLELQENSISHITEKDFEGLVKLDSLGLAHNHLRTVPPRAFSHLQELNSLELDGNSITHINPDAFVGLEVSLQYLRLGDNNIHQIPSDALKPLHRLRHLDLRSNNISYIAEDAFTGYGDSITFLNLQKNNIKMLPSMGFDNLNSLETLNLQNNKISHIPEEIMEPIVDTLRVVDIMDNPLLCDCELRWYKEWIKNLKDKDDEMMQKKRTVCTMENEHREYPVQNMPMDRMNCVGKNMERTSASSAPTLIVSALLPPLLMFTCL
ncbi:unnamed protein product [Nesidiocoris tenuis]|uniref:LRRCT domain-containing protein n=1 Tax=Nesidiocoris tenuis TaxID=355587 RepID=A0A6H5FVV8_9HEMI|nr:unnamed protein product [Nesidiocoris tenuis]